LYLKKTLNHSELFAMLSVSVLLLKIMRRFEGLYEKKQFYLVKNGEVGRISALLMKILKNKYF